MNDAQKVATLIAETLMDHNIDPTIALPGMSFALIVSARQMGLSQQGLKDRLCGDVDIIYRNGGMQ